MGKRIVSLSIVVALLILAFALGIHAGSAGNGEPPAPPDLTSSYTLEDIYNRLDTGAAGSQNPFAEPASGPGTGTMHSLDDIMAVAPAVDNTKGAVPAEVLAGKTYWGLRTDGTWGTQTGTMPDNGVVTYTPNTTDQPVAAGYHSGSGYVAGDADLVPGNIVDDVSIFDVTGTYPLAPVPKTGQTRCYKSESVSDWSPCTCGTEDCPSGQDGDLEKGVAWPNPRFTDNGDGTVTDNLTGLIWLENANCTAFFANDVTGKNNRPWGDALTAANSLSAGYCGLLDDSSSGDWRLPNLRELQSLVYFYSFEPAVPNTAGTEPWSEGDAFSGIQLDPGYWSSTSNTFSPDLAYCVSMYVGGQLSRDKSIDGSVWPVRGGQ